MASQGAGPITLDGQGDVMHNPGIGAGLADVAYRLLGSEGRRAAGRPLLLREQAGCTDRAGLRTGETHV